MVNEVQKNFSKDRFFVGDTVLSKMTPHWGEGKVVGIYPDHFYGVIFKTNNEIRAPEIAFKCHFTGLKWVNSKN